MTGAEASRNMSYHSLISHVVCYCIIVKKMKTALLKVKKLRKEKVL